MAAFTADPVVRLLLTGVLCLVPTVAFLGLLRLLDRLRNDVLVEHTMRMAAEEGATSDLVASRFDPALALAAGSGSNENAPDDGDEWGDPSPKRRLVLCSECATLRSGRPGSCPSCGAPLETDDPTSGAPR